jgi:nucleoside-diphosphate-sugar epimerase
MSAPQHILLTGAFGSLGRFTQQALVDRGHQVRALDLDTPANRRASRRRPAGVEVVWGDLRDPASVASAVAGVDVVLHMGFVIPPLSEARPALAREVNVVGTQTLLTAAAAQPVPPRFVFTSSYHVHPHIKTRTPPITVDEPVAGSDHYATHKIACERAVTSSGLRWSILRLSSAMLDRAPDATNLRLVFGIPLDTRMEMIHPTDAALAHAVAATSSACEGRVLFIGGGPSCQTTYRELLTLSFAARGLPMLPERAFPTSPPFIGDWLDTAESQRLLQYQRISLHHWLQTEQTSPAAARLAARVFAPLVTRWMLRYAPGPTA